MADQRASELIARYGELLDGESSELDYVDLLSDLLVDILVHHGVTARRSRAGALSTAGTVAIPLASMNVSLEIAGFNGPVTPQQVTEVSVRSSPYLRMAMLAMHGFADGVGDVADEVVLLDRHHLEALLAGLMDPVTLLEEVIQQAIFEGRPYTPLTSLLVAHDPAPAAQCAPPDRVRPPWELVRETADQVRVRQILGGRPGWPEATGMTVLDEQRLLVTTADGLLAVHIRRGTADWFLAMSGLQGAPLVRADGSVLVICGDALISYSNGQIVPVAGGFHNAAALTQDSGGQTWILSGTGAVFGSDTGTLSLTLIGDGFGRQQTYRIGFGAAVHGMTWLQGRRFFLAAGSDSAVVDLSRSSAVQDSEKVRSEQSYPQHVIAFDASNVLCASTSGSGVEATLYLTDLVGHRTALVARLALNKVQGLASDGEHVYVLGDVRGNDHLRPQPVILKATLPRQAPREFVTDPEPAGDVRQAARGVKRDYVLDPQPIAGGGQAIVIGARHRVTGLPVAFKRLRNKSPDDIARFHREVEAGQRFGDNPHVVPVLDYDPAAGWLVMPLADCTAEEMLDELEDPQRLIELVSAICNGLRTPHLEGWIHRDLKPANVLRLNGVWAVADWGLGRRPRGRTSHPGRTHLGVLYGTEGFAAPELSDDAHQARPQADIYSLGQIIGWARTQSWPRANRPLIPADAPWDSIVEAMTHDDLSQRPSSVDDVLALVKPTAKSSALHTGPPVPLQPGERLLAAVPDTVAQDSPPLMTGLAASPPLVLNGILGRIEFDGRVVKIIKNGYGHDMKGTHAIGIHDVQAITLKPATRWNHGYLQIIADGNPPAPESRGLFLGGRPPMQDSLSLSFRHRANDEANRIKHAIEEAVLRLTGTGG